MESNPVLLLQSYGLDQLLTDQDDPYLWAIAVDKHWPRLDLDLQMPRLLFGIGRIPDGEEITHSDIKIEEQWRFERTDMGGIIPVRIEREASHYFADRFLEVSRPSANRATAIIHAGGNPAPLIGRGEARVWKRQADGSWIETDKIVFQWIT